MGIIPGAFRLERVPLPMRAERTGYAENRNISLCALFSRLTIKHPERLGERLLWRTHRSTLQLKGAGHAAFFDSSIAVPFEDRTTEVLLLAGPPTPKRFD